MLIIYACVFHRKKDQSSTKNDGKWRTQWPKKKRKIENVLHIYTVKLLSACICKKYWQWLLMKLIWLLSMYCSRVVPLTMISVSCISLFLTEYLIGTVVNTEGTVVICTVIKTYKCSSTFGQRKLWFIYQLTLGVHKKGHNLTPAKCQMQCVCLPCFGVKTCQTDTLLSVWVKV